MSLPYIRPGVTVTEVVSPGVSTVLLDPNILTIIGPARGFENHVQVLLLDDNNTVQLRALNIDKNTIVVKDASNTTLTPFVVSDVIQDNDYTVTSDILTGVTTISRSMQTAIDTGETVVLYYENADPAVSSSDAETETSTLVRLVPNILANSDSLLNEDSIVVLSRGVVHQVDYVVANSGLSGTTIKIGNAPVFLQTFQTVYLDFDIANVEDSQVVDFSVTLNGTTPVALPDFAENIVVKTAPGILTDPCVQYDLGSILDESGDYIVEGTGAATTVRRARGTTTIGGLNDRLVVRISYQATPLDYWAATRCLSQADVEDKFGPPFDSQGNIINPLSAATLLAFQNGATTVIAQALFSLDPDSGLRGPPTGGLDDWDRTLEGLHAIDDMTVIVPIISTPGILSVEPTDGLNLEILNAVQLFVEYMRSNLTRFVMAICGEDSTGGVMASVQTMQDHGSVLGDGPFPEQYVLLSETSYNLANPVTGRNTLIGGQYAAAAVAGMMARYSVQTPLTGKRIAGLSSLNTRKSIIEKDADAQAGLCVVEVKQGRMQIRHAITTSEESRAHQEMSVIRARNWMLANLVNAFENQVVGRMVIDQQSAFTVQVLLESELDLLIQMGSIVSYDNVQLRQDPLDPTAIQVRFTYKPTFPLNHVNIIFSIDSTSGVTFNQSSPTQGF